MSYERRAQMTIFVIIAIVIVAGIVIYFIVRDRLGLGGISSELQPVFEHYEECIKQEARTAIELAESQGGFINVDYEPGSEYAPFSSQLNFLGFPIPYWYYVSGNGLIKEQVPLRGDIENGIAEYVEERANDCDFESFYAQGFSISLDEADAKVGIDEDNVNVEVNSEIVVSKGDEIARKNIHEVNVDSKLGKFYDIARKIYEKERDSAIFDNYGVDVLRLYAPVDGVEISCSGKVWKTTDVVNELKLGLEANIGKIKARGNYYDLNDKKDEYYVFGIGENVDENVNFIYLKDMPTKVELVGEGVDDSLMIASPVGIQEGLGVMGFCYAPYHFVYDVSFPVLVQVYNNEEIFQFPIVAIIDNNVAREAVFSESEFEAGGEFDLCEFNAQDVEINLYDNNLNKINGNIDYQCFDQRCRLGETSDGSLIGKAPSCLNGYLLVSADGFEEKKELFSSNKDRAIDVILDREYEVEIEFEFGGRAIRDESAIISFSKGEKSVSAVLPDVSKIKLSEGSYELKVYVYGNSSIRIAGGKKTQCQEVPRAGILGFFGSTKEECFDIVLPETKIEHALIGGGNGNSYISESQLEDGRIKVRVDSLPVPKSLEELQYNYASFDSLGVDVE